MGLLTPLSNAIVGRTANPAEQKGMVPMSGVSKPAAWLVDALGGGGATASGVKIGADNAMRSTTALRCVSLLAETVAMLPLVMYQENRDGVREKALKHPVFRVVLKRPNPWQSAYEFWRQMMTHVALRGNAFAYIKRDNKGRVEALYPVHPDLVQLYRMEDGRLFFQFRLWHDTAQMMECTQDNMLVLRWMTQDSYVGLSPVELCAQSLGINVASEEYQARFFGQGAKLSGVLTIPGKLNDEAHTRVSGFWNKFFQGLHNAHKVAVLSDGATFNPISIKPQDAQFLELRQFQVDDIARIWGVPPHMVGSTTKSTSWGTGIEQMTMGFLRYSIFPHLKMIVGACERDLLLPNDEQDYTFKHDITELMGGDMLSMANWAAKMFSIGAMNPNEIRAHFGMNPYKGGDTFRAMVNTSPLDEEGMSVADDATASAAEAAEQPAVGNGGGDNEPTNEKP